MANRIVTSLFITALWLAPAAVFAQDQVQVERGTKVYTDQKCSTCHAIGGKGNAKGALDDLGNRLKADEIRAWIVTPAKMTEKAKAPRKPAMRAYPKLPKNDLDALVVYLASLKKK